MSSYQFPARDLRFVLQEVLRAQAVLSALPRYAGVDAELLESIAEQAGRFAADRVAPLNATADRVGCRWVEGRVATPPGFPQAYAAYCELGWPGVCADEAHGGQELPRLAFSLVNELQAAASHAFVMYSAVNHCAAACLRHSASAALQTQWLPQLASGAVLASMCMTEPQAGSDIGLIRTESSDQGDGTYRVTGAKIFASGAEHDLSDNILHLVLARLRGSAAGSRGLSLFIVPKRLPDGSLNGVHCDGIEHKMGLHGSATCSLRFEAAQGWLVGDPNLGLRAMFPMMNEARLLSGLQAVGLSDRALQSALRHAHERHQGRSPAGAQPCPIVDHPDVQRMLMTQKAWTEGGRAFVHWVALLIDVADWHPDAGQRRDAEMLTGLLTPVVKGFLTENAQASIGLALQVHGGHGYIRETGVEQLARDARVTTLYEGTTGIQAQDLLLRKVLADGGERLRVLEGEVRRWLAGPGTCSELAAFAAQLTAQLAVTLDLTEHLAQRERAHAGASLSAAVHYLRVVGHLVFALLWARMAEAACEGAKGGDAWYQAKLATAHFYFAQMLPEMRQLETVIRAPAIDFAVALTV